MHSGVADGLLKAGKGLFYDQPGVLFNTPVFKKIAGTYSPGNTFNLAGEIKYSRLYGRCPAINSRDKAAHVPVPLFQRNDSITPLVLIRR
jgi:hypothetical protein